MSRSALQRLLREWAALLAVLAFMLAPLALGVTRSLDASDKVAIAAGAKAPALCLPGADGGPPAGGMDCDHCTAAQSFPLLALAGMSVQGMAGAGALSGDDSQTPRPFPRAPPARGPPTA